MCKGSISPHRCQYLLFSVFFFFNFNTNPPLGYEVISPNSFDLHFPNSQWGFRGGSVIKKPPATQEIRVQFLGLEDAQEKKWQSSPVFLPGKPHGQRSVLSCSPRGHKESKIRLSNWVWAWILSDTDHLFMLAICLSSLEKQLFKSFAQLKIRWFGFGCCWVWVFYIPLSLFFFLLKKIKGSKKCITYSSLWTEATWFCSSWERLVHPLRWVVARRAKSRSCQPQGLWADTTHHINAHPVLTAPCAKKLLEDQLQSTGGRDSEACNIHLNKGPTFLRPPLSRKDWRKNTACGKIHLNGSVQGNHLHICS